MTAISYPFDFSKCEIAPQSTTGARASRNRTWVQCGGEYGVLDCASEFLERRRLERDEKSGGYIIRMLAHED